MKLMNKFMKKHEGFTLVELIVVIAILAILAGVAVPAYSAYITRANKQADMTLVGQIITAAELGYYSDEFDGTAAVILQQGKNAVIKGGNADSEAWLNTALTSAFGSNYAASMQLKYGEWGNGALVAQDVLTYFSSVAADNALYGIYNGTVVPSFAEEVDDLFVLVKDTAGWVGEKLDQSGAELVQGAAKLTANNSVTAAEFAAEWASSAWDNNFLMGDGQGSSYNSNANQLTGTALENAVANAGVLKGRNISIASYLSNNGYPEVYSVFADYNFAGTSIPNDAAGVILSMLEKDETGVGDPTDEELRLLSTMIATFEANGYVGDLAYVRLAEVGAALSGYYSEGQAYKDGLAYYAMMDTVNNVNNEEGATDEEYWDDMESAVNLYGSIARGEASLAELSNVYNALNGVTDDAVVVTVMSQNGTLVISVGPKAANPVG